MKVMANGNGNDNERVQTICWMDTLKIRNDEGWMKGKMKENGDVMQSITYPQSPILNE